MQLNSNNIKSIVFKYFMDFLSYARIRWRRFFRSKWDSTRISLTRRPRCSRILLARVRKASSMLMFSLHDTSKKGISKFSAIFWPLSASTARCAVASHLFAAKTFTTSGDAFCDANDGIAYDSQFSYNSVACRWLWIDRGNIPSWN